MKSLRVGDIAAARFGSGPPALLVHPLAFSKTVFTEAAEIYGEHFDCIAVDLPGHGDSAPVRDTDTLADVAQRLIAVLDEVGWTSAIVGGTSLGAATTLRLALSHPDRVTRLLQDLPAFAPTSAMRKATASSIEEALAADDAPEALRRIVKGLPTGPAQALTRVLEVDWPRYAGLPTRLATAFRAIRRWRVTDEWPQALTAVTALTVVLGLKGDPSHPFEVAETLVASIPNATLVSRTPSLSPDAVARQWVTHMKWR